MVFLLTSYCTPVPPLDHCRKSFRSNSISHAYKISQAGPVSQLFSLPQVGLYRISGTERLVKELKDKLLRGKTLPPLSKVEDINVITGVLKDFLRNLPEPLLTFHLNKAFMDAAG